MKATGIVRKMDNLGRIVIPMELRNTMGIGKDTPLELFVMEDMIALKKYVPESSINGYLDSVAKEVDGLCTELGVEKTREIRRHIKEVRGLLG